MDERDPASSTILNAADSIIVKIIFIYSNVVAKATENNFVIYAVNRFFFSIWQYFVVTIWRVHFINRFLRFLLFTGIAINNDLTLRVEITFIK